MDKIIKGMWELVVFIHKMGLMFIWQGIFEDRHYGIGWRILEVILGLGLVILLLALYIFIIYGIYVLIRRISIMIRTKKVKYYNVVGKVVDKEYISGYTSFTMSGRVVVPSYHPEEYNVYVQYKDVSEVFDDKKLFNRYKVNSKIPLVLIRKLDNKNKIIEQILRLPR